MSDAPPVMQMIVTGWPKRNEFCTSTRRNKWGHIAHSCTFPAGHENDHRDIHSGATWK